MDLGIKKYVGRYFHHKQADREKASPTSEMLASREYYDTHMDEIKLVESLLEDQESIDVYVAMWKYRCTHDYKHLPKFDEKKQYFGYDFFQYVEGEKLIDCGAYDGDTIDVFEKCMKRKGIRNYSVVAFETDPQNCKYIGSRKNVTVIAKGVYDKEGVMYFSSESETGGKILNDLSVGRNVIEIPVCKIDDEYSCQDATMLKMDIEGAEWNALHGAEQYICRVKPKLAICIYHSDEDMIRIPMWVESLGLGYKMYVRQHSDTKNETVLYGVPK